MNDLFAAATAARANAHAPYSRFHVGAALRAASGRVYAGCNVENAAFPQGQCAEASAIGALVTAGERDVVEILVVGGGEGLCTPCGGCRQRLAEFADPGVPVHLCGPEGPRSTVSLAELLPLAFTGRNLGRADPAERAAGDWRAALARLRPRVAVVLGSGLGAFADEVEEPVEVAYADVPGFPRPTVPGHAGRLVLGRCGGVPVAVLQGRVHLYECPPPGLITRWLTALRDDLGVEALLLTNASGSLRPEVGPGSLVLVEDHINLTGANPLAGAREGPRFVDMSEAYDPGLRAALARAADAEGVRLERGVYLAVLGPSFETPAEIRAFRALGADLVGMSTVPEVIAARALGLRAAAVSVATNLAAGMTPEPLSHEQTLAASSRAAADLARLLRAALPEIARAAT
jgi:purine nucleotide phosphorylase/homotetrameric cytidine deaminase